MKRKRTADKGYFPKGTSVLRQVHSSRYVGLLYGQRALLIGGTDPRNYVGTSQHTRERATPFRRLARTAESFETIFFGSRAEADVLLKRIEMIHAQVKGELTQAAGNHPAGTAYAAFDPSMMLWTIACIANSALTLYELLERRLSEEEREALWQDYLLLGELFGMPRKTAPATYLEFRDYFERRLTGSELHLTEAAEYMGKQVCFNVPMPSYLLPAKKLVGVILLGSLPPEIRELYHFPWSAAQERTYRAAIASLRTMGKSLHPKVKSGKNSAFFKLVTDTENAQKQKGKGITMPDHPY